MGDSQPWLNTSVSWKHLVKPEPRGDQVSVGAEAPHTPHGQPRSKGTASEDRLPSRNDVSEMTSKMISSHVFITLHWSLSSARMTHILVGMIANAY